VAEVVLISMQEFFMCSRTVFKVWCCHKIEPPQRYKLIGPCLTTTADISLMLGVVDELLNYSC
jgi:hypothetical protein